MLNIYTLPVGQLETNCYIVHRSGEPDCAVIDPGAQAEEILAFTREKGLTVTAILLTHGHFDHVGGVEALVKATGCALWMHERDYTQRKTPVSDFFYPIHDCEFTNVHFCEEGEVIHVGGLTFSVMDTPGHTWGSVCYLCEDALFSGDTLFEGSCGRTDLPGGNGKWLLESLSRLAGLETDFTVYPGHGRATTLEKERRNNPYLKG